MVETGFTLYFYPMISRRHILTGVTGLLTSLIGGAAFATTGPTLVPKKVGQTIVWRGKKYTAIKSGKKIVWNKGVAIPTSAPTSTPTASATPSATNASGQVIVGASSEVAEGSSKIFLMRSSSGRSKGFVITRSTQGLVGFDNVCTHEGCAVEVDTDQLACYCHNSFFNRTTGAVLRGPARRSLMSYPVSEINGQIVVTDPTF